jgi:hypothetical protein
MKKIKILYWVFTILFAFLMIGSAIPNIISDPVSVEGFGKMNMPAYLLPFLGIAKALGVIAILITGYPRIKEWAYAGLIFDLIGGAWCIYASGQPVQSWAFMPIPIALGFASYTFYHKKAKLADAQKAKSNLTEFSAA